MTITLTPAQADCLLWYVRDVAIGDDVAMAEPGRQELVQSLEARKVPDEQIEYLRRWATCLLNMDADPGTPLLARRVLAKL